MFSCDVALAVAVCAVVLVNITEYTNIGTVFAVALIVFAGSAVGTCAISIVICWCLLLLLVLFL